MAIFTLLLTSHVSRDEALSRDKMCIQSAHPLSSLPTVHWSVSPAPSSLPAAWLWMSQTGDKHSGSIHDPLMGRCGAEYSCWQSQVMGDRKTNIRDLPTVPEQVTAAWKESWSQWYIGEIPDLTVTHLHLQRGTEPDDRRKSWLPAPQLSTWQKNQPFFKWKLNHSPKLCSKAEILKQI